MNTLRCLSQFYARYVSLGEEEALELSDCNTLKCKNPRERIFTRQRVVIEG